MKKLLIILIFICFTTSCGYHLRGKSSLPLRLMTLSISPDTPYTPFQRKLRQILKYNDVKIVNNAYINTDTVILNIISEDYLIENLTLNSRGQSNSQKVSIIVKYKIIDPKNLLDQNIKTILLSKTFNFDANAVLQANNERTILKRELANESVAQIIRQLSLS